MCFEKMLWGKLEMVSARTFKPWTTCCSAPHENLLVWISWSSGNERKPLSKQKYVLGKCYRDICRNGEC